MIAERPSASGGTIYVESEAAEVSTLIKRSHRRRVRELEDGTTVLEEQDCLFTEKKTVWGPKLAISDEDNVRPGPE
jgi:hypothetical protein